MRRHTFGKTITTIFSYAEDSAPSADAPSIFLYSEQPTRANAKIGAGSNLVGSEITSWSTGTPDNSKQITIPAISDPEPTTSTTTRTYYLAINYTVEASGDSDLVITKFLVSRIVGTLSGHELEVQDLVNIFPTIDDYIADADLAKFLTAALDKTERDLRKKRNIRFDQVINQDDLKYAIALKAVSLAVYSEFENEGDQFYIRAKQYESDYLNEIDSLEIEVDTDQDGVTDVKSQVKKYFVYNNAR